MPKITAVFSDVGGVLLTNGWDRSARRSLVERFGLNGEDFEDRHELVVTAFETGALDLDHYLERTIFYRPHTFSRQDVRDFMFAQSQPFPESLAVIARLAQTGKYFLAILNNESRELNLYRIERFGLRNWFTAFFSSCFLGVKKPDEAIYKLAIEIAQQPPEQCVFIDDRGLNLESPQRLGMQTIQFQNAAQLEHDLRNAGVDF